jgi:hypothetical protein
MEKSSHREANSWPTSHEVPGLYGKTEVVTVFTRARRWSLS